MVMMLSKRQKVFILTIVLTVLLFLYYIGHQRTKGPNIIKEKGIQHSDTASTDHHRLKYADTKNTRKTQEKLALTKWALKNNISQRRHFEKKDMKYFANVSTAPRWPNYSDKKNRREILSILRKTCLTNGTQQLLPYTMDDVLLVVTFNTPQYFVIPYLEVIYSGVFPNRVYCGKGKPNATDLQGMNITFVSENITPGGTTYQCLLKVMQSDMNDRYKGFIHASDDISMNVWNLKLPRSVPWYNTNDATSVPWPYTVSLNCAVRGEGCLYPWFKCVGKITTWFNSFFYRYKTRLLRVLKIIHTRHGKHVTECSDRLRSFGAGHKTAFFIGQADFYYIPRKMVSSFVSVGNIFMEHEIWMEITIPTLMYCLSPRNEIHVMPGTMYWGYHRKGLVNKFEKHKEDSWFHPAKLSSLARKSHETPDVRQYFCKYFEKLHSGKSGN